MKSIQKQLKEILPELKSHYPIEWMALFGSSTRPDYNPEKSDIDILVEFNGDIGWEFILIAEELESKLGRKVDLVSRGGLKPRHWEYLKTRLQYV